MNIRRFRDLHTAGATYAEIARECGVEWRTVKKCLAEDAPSAPPPAARRGPYPAHCDRPVLGVVEAWQRKDIALKGTVILERLVATTT